jgi:hypothetical protein
VLDRSWIVAASDQSRVANKKTGLDGACFGLVRVWADRILSHPSEAPALRMNWVRAHEQEAVEIQKSYAAIKSDAVKRRVELGLRDQTEADQYGAQQGLARGRIDLDTGAAIGFRNMRYPPVSNGRGGYGPTSKWYFDGPGEDVAANTAYFWDIGMAQQPSQESGLHACASRHLTSLENPGWFEFYDPNMGELRVPNASWSTFMEGWVLRYTEGHPVIFVDALTMLPMRRLEAQPADVIRVVEANWNAGWFRSKSAASTHAMARLKLLITMGPPADLLEAIRWYAGRIVADPTGALATKHGAKPAQNARLPTLLRTHFGTHLFFTA